MPDLIYTPIYEVARLIEDGQVSSRELTEAALGQVERYGDLLNPFITLTADLALAMAEERDRERSGGTLRGPLHGIPIVLKDLLDTAGIRTTGGSKVYADRVPKDDAPVVSLLREAGAVFIGKTGMPEFAEQPSSINPHYGAVRNPWNTAFDPGGSSSGTGVAIASGMAWCGPGSDTGGSIRIPAAACGLVGLKPTYGRVSLRGVLPLAASMDHIGPMARTVRDAALLMNALAWYDEDDPLARDHPLEDYAAGLEYGVSGLRVAAFHDDGGDPVPDDILAAYRVGLETLSAAGAHVEEIDLSFIASNDDDGSPYTAEVHDHYGHLLNEKPEDLSDYMRAVLERGRKTTGSAVIAALRQRAALLHQIERRLNGYDLAVSPTLGVHPPPVGEPRTALVRFTILWDCNGWPAISVPVGLSPDNIPIGFQIIARPWQESLTLRAARVIERAYSLEFPAAGLE